MPLGLVTTTVQRPIAAVDGNGSRQVIFVGDTTTTLVAAMSPYPYRVSMTVAPDWKPVPARVGISMVDPCVPALGEMDSTESGALTVIMPALVVVVDPAALLTVSETV